MKATRAKTNQVAAQIRKYQLELLGNEEEKKEGKKEKKKKELRTG